MPEPFKRHHALLLAEIGPCLAKEPGDGGALTCGCARRHDAAGSRASSALSDVPQLIDVDGDVDAPGAAAVQHQVVVNDSPRSARVQRKRGHALTTLPPELANQVSRGDLQKIIDALAADPSLITARSADNDTLLHLACWQKQLAIVGTLLGFGADPKALGDSGFTPLHYAVKEGRLISVPIVGMLLAAGADPMVRDGNGWSFEDAAKGQLADGLSAVLDLIQRWCDAHPPRTIPP